MSIKNTNYGGTDWGIEGLNKTDLNDTFDATYAKVIQYPLFVDTSTTDTVAKTDSSDAWITKKTLTFTPTTSNNIILGIKLEAALSGGGTIGSMRLSVDLKARTLAASESDITTKSQTSTTDVSGTLVTATCWMMPTAGTIATPSVNAGVLCGEASYDINVQILSTSGNTCTIDDIDVTVYYLDNGIATDNSGKFS